MEKVKFVWLVMCINQFSSVAQSCPTLCDLTDCSTPGFPGTTNSRSLLKLLSFVSVMPYVICTYNKLKY